MPVISDVSAVSLLSRTIVAAYINSPGLSPLFKNTLFEISGLQASTGLCLWSAEKGRMEAGRAGEVDGQVGGIKFSAY